ncbi:ParB/RepB/Spo0J family partition protein [Pantanalinema sp. GBBB05]|uniref:ParB/RepB/Spo0J family partition protein n=1 Tax=Pantanalinema sp. GBBB05 TaxID=2604139 RepID=UPI001DECC16F|nr:ParB/RepB/Spo0J family partition protein [Pantanalinema sp. GBBB05]
MGKATRNADFFSLSQQTAELESAQERIAELEAFNQQLQTLVGTQVSSHAKNAITVPITSIVRDPEQARRWFDPEEQAKLTAAMREFGFRGRLWVRALPDSKYQLVAGERRLRSALAAEFTEVPVEILDIDDDLAIVLSLLENLQRVDLNPIEETQGILRLLSRRLQCSVAEVTSLLYRMKNQQQRQEEPTLEESQAFATINQVFETIGRISWMSFITMRLPLLNFPQEILDALQQGQIEYTKATIIARVKDEQPRLQLLQDTIANNLSLSEVKLRAKEIKPSRIPSLQEEFKQVIKALPKALKDPRKAKAAQALLEKLKQLVDE